jgi:hypothetical protein
VILTGRLPVELWCLFTAMPPRVFDLVFCKTLFSNKYYVTLVILYPFSVWYVC